MISNKRIIRQPSLIKYKSIYDSFIVKSNIIRG